MSFWWRKQSSERQSTEKTAKERSNFKNGISHSTDNEAQFVKYKAPLAYLTKTTPKLTFHSTGVQRDRDRLGRRQSSWHNGTVVDVEVFHLGSNQWHTQQGTFEFSKLRFFPSTRLWDVWCLLPPHPCSQHFNNLKPASRTRQRAWVPCQHTQEDGRAGTGPQHCLLLIKASCCSGAGYYGF